MGVCVYVHLCSWCSTMAWLAAKLLTHTAATESMAEACIVCGETDSLVVPQHALLIVELNCIGVVIHSVLYNIHTLGKTDCIILYDRNSLAMGE